MKSFEYTITDAVGIHARPAGMLVKKASAFQSHINLSSGGKNADVKKLLALMSLGVKKDATLVVTVEGNDEEEAAKELLCFFQENL